MSAPLEDEMDVRSEELDVGQKAKSSEQEEPGLRQAIRRLSLSPPRSRTESPSSSTWRTDTPPPPAAQLLAMRPRVETPTAALESSSLPRTLSSPSLMDSSPKVEPAKKSPVPTACSPATFSRKSAKANELTPIARNTRGQFVDEGHIVVSPDDGMADDAPLLGERLALQPSHVGFSEGRLQQRRFSAPSLPPLPMPSERAKSMGRMLHNEDDDVLGEPVRFPSDRKCCHYSFTSSQQFSQSTTSPTSSQRGSGLIPYQPTREDDNVGSFSDTVLGGIFQDAVPLEERQYSIPSIHLAHHLNGSTTSYTDEEDDLLQRGDDDASLSSRGSSLYLPGEDVEEAAKPLRLNVAAAKMAFRHDSTEESAAAFCPPPPSHDSDNDADQEQEDVGKKRTKKRTKRKERQAIEWIRSIESTNHDISEAASSKFLTSTNTQQVNHRRRYHRNASSPALEEQLSGAFPPQSDTFPPPTH